MTSPLDGFWRNRSRLSGGGLYLEGNEPGRQNPDEFQGARVRLLLCRLSTYNDVRPSITHRMLYWAARQVPGVYVDLAFFPPRADLPLFERDGVPVWLASGCKFAPAAFDIIAVSIAAQQEALNLPAALKLSGLKLGFEDRMADDAHPLVILGGHAAASVPFLHGAFSDGGRESAGLVDAVCAGDGIAWLQEFLSRFQRGRSKGEFLTRLSSELPGTYVPSLYRHIFQGGRLTAIEPTVPNIPLPVKHREDDHEIWLGGYDGAFIPFTDEDGEETLPLASGCGYRCRFCQTGWVRKKFAESGTDELCRAALRLKAAMAASDLNLLASDACSVPSLIDAVQGLRGIFDRVSVKSLAISSLLRRRDFRTLIGSLEKREFTFGVEGISTRLRAYFGKSADASALVEVISDFLATGVRQVKLFFIATGLETEADVEEFGRLLTRLRRSAPRCRIITSFTPLFNAPFTPLQFEEIRDIPAALARALEATARSAGAEFRWSASPAEVGLMNLLCRAGRAATATLVHLSIEKGFRYFDHLPDAALDAALKHVEASGIAIEHLAAVRKESDVLPWDDLEAGTNRNKLWRSFKKASADWENPPEQLAEGEAAPMRLVKLPLPSLAPRELAWWVEIPRENADHPDITVARGLLRNVLQASEAVTRAYSGPLTLVRPNGAFGIALLSAEFKGLTVNPDASFDAASVDPSQFLYLVRLTDKSFDHFAEMLHGRRVSFQTVHHDDHRWLVVGKTFRHRCGITAAGEVAEGMIVFCGSQAGEQVRGGEVLAAYGRSETKCPRCGAKTLNLLKGSAPAGVPECPDCLVK